MSGGWLQPRRSNAKGFTKRKKTSNKNLLAIKISLPPSTGKGWYYWDMDNVSKQMASFTSILKIFHLEKVMFISVLEEVNPQILQCMFCN